MGICVDSSGKLEFKTYYLDKKNSRIKQILKDKDLKIIYID